MPLRRATPSDVPQIAALVDLAYEKYVARIGRKPKPMLADYNLAVSTHEIWVHDRDGAIQAVLELIPGETHLLIENVAVHPKAQGQGLGGQLLLFAEEAAVRRGFTEVRLYTNERFIENLAIYSKRGYRELYRESIGTTQAVHMSKPMPEQRASSDGA